MTSFVDSHCHINFPELYQNIALEESLLSFTGGSPFNAIKELENKSEREAVRITKILKSLLWRSYVALLKRKRL
ncbi:MAG: hypothetical protein RIT47_255 [Pseudomonadota bacterium]